MHYLKILFIISSLFIFDFSLATSTCKTVFSDIPEKVISYKNSVWQIENSETTGTVFFISPNQFVTNFHVVEAILERRDKFNTITISQDGNHQGLKIKNIQKLSAIHDLAILEIDGEVKNYLPLKNALSTKEDLFLVGYPDEKFQILATKQETFLLNENSYYGFYLDYSGTLGGASGSPILNKEGEVIGIFSESISGFSGSGFIGLFHRFVIARKTKPLQNLLQEKTEFFSNSYEDIKKEEIKLKKMAEQGHALAQRELAVRLLDSMQLKNKEKVFYWYKKAAEQDDPFAMIMLEDMYFFGRGTAIDLKKADYWKEKLKNKFNIHYR